MRIIESTNIASILATGDRDTGGSDSKGGQIYDLNLITPMSSMNVTPTEPEVISFRIKRIVNAFINQN